MSNVLACPHCGATMAVSRPVCGRCGKELTFVDDLGDLRTTVELTTAERRQRVISRAGIAVLCLVGAVAAIVGARRLQQGGSKVDPMSLREALAAAASSDSREQTEAVAQGPAAAGEAAASGFDAPAQALSAYRAGDLERALGHYRDALAERPGDPQALDNLGQVLVELGRPGEAVPYLKRAAEAEHDNATIRFNLAVALARAGDADHALYQYDRLIRAGVTDPRVYHNRGLLFRQQGRHGEAVEAFEQATALDPDNAPAWMGLGLSLQSAGRMPEAGTAFERYLALKPDDPEAEKIKALVRGSRNVNKPPEL